MGGKGGWIFSPPSGDRDRGLCSLALYINFKRVKFERRCAHFMVSNNNVFCTLYRTKTLKILATYKDTKSFFSI